METRELTESEIAILATGCGIPNTHYLYDAITCEGDAGYGPCGTYLDWADGHCRDGHEIEVDTSSAEQWVSDHADGDSLDDEELADAFRLLYGREPDDDDRREGLWSYCCAAVG